MEILRLPIGFTLLTASGCASVTRVVGRIPHTTLAYMIHGPHMCKIINPSPCLLPMSFKRKWQQQVENPPKLLTIMEEEPKPRPPINGDTAPDYVGGLHHMGAAILASQYAGQTKSVCEHHKNAVSDPLLSLFIV